MIGSLVLLFFTSLQNLIAIKQEKPCLRRKYGDFQKVLSDPRLNIAEQNQFKLCQQTVLENIQLSIGKIWSSKNHSWPQAPFQDFMIRGLGQTIFI